MASKHPLRRLFDTAEQLVAGPAEKVVNAPRASYVMLTGSRAALWGWRELQRTRSRTVHLWGLASSRDLQRVGHQLTRLQHSLDEIEQQLQEQQHLLDEAREKEGR